MELEEASKCDIGVVTRPAPSPEAYATSISGFTHILAPSSDSLYLFGGGAIDSDVSDKISKFVDVGDGVYTGLAPVDFFILQVVISFAIFSNRSELELIYFQKGAMGLTLPVIIARLCRLRVCTIKIGAFATDRASDLNNSILINILNVLQRLSFRLSHAVVVFSRSERHSIPNDTVFIAYSEYVDFDSFSHQKPHSEREVDIGFVGRFADTKGILSLEEASKNLTDKYPNLRVRLVGDGPRYEEVAERTREDEGIELTGWVEREALPEHYNDIRFLFLPSVGEGLPTTVLEAMGCGAIVVATPVGSLVDLIEDGHRGFSLNDNSVGTIEETYDQIRQREDLNVIAANQREFVVSNYSLTAAQENFQMITQQLVT
jgi:glycosyltransferase involved in cell wall biosynthesis